MKNYKLILLALGVALFSTSCVVDDEDEKLDAMSNTAYAIGFSETVQNITYFEDVGTVENDIAISVFGGGDGTGVESDVIVNYSINQELSTATEGVEFTIENQNNSILIPAGEKFGVLELIANTGQFNATMPTKLVLDINTSVENVHVITKYSRVTITFVGCDSDLAGSYTVEGDGTVLTITESSSGSYIVDNLFIVTPAYEWYFSDVCDDLTITGFELGGYTLLGSGTVNPDGSLTFTGVQLLTINPSPVDFTLIPN